MVKQSGPTKLHKHILELLKQNPSGLSIHEIREQLAQDLGPQEELNKRVRELRKWYNVPLRPGNRYVFLGLRATPAADNGAVSAKLRAAVLNAAHGRCQMCGMTVSEDGIKLQADHKVPSNWGGETTLENLWALCQLCNGGKRDFFSSLNEEEMREIVSLDSVYERISEILRLNLGKPVPSWLLQFVANVNDFQDDWQKRLRELRYPVIGMKIKSTRAITATGKVESAYVLEEWKELPLDHKSKIKAYERENKIKNGK